MFTIEKKFISFNNAKTKFIRNWQSNLSNLQ